MNYIVYVDLTHDLIPFYVGYGGRARFKNLKRNTKHQGIAKKYGIIRVAVLNCWSKEEAKAHEIVVLADCQTNYYEYPENHFACNFTRGGDGSDGFKHTDIARAKMKGRVPHNKGQSSSIETRDALRQANLGKKASKETRLKMSIARAGKYDDAAKAVIEAKSVILQRIQQGETRLKIAEEFNISFSYFCKLLKR